MASANTTELYQDAPISTNDAVNQFMKIVQRFHLANEATNEPLQFINKIMPQPNRFPATNYYLEQNFVTPDRNYVINLCAHCGQLLGEKKESTGTVNATVEKFVMPQAVQTAMNFIYPTSTTNAASFRGRACFPAKYDCTRYFVIKL